MNTRLSSYEHLHLLGECATHPIARRISRLAALVVLAGCSLRRPPPCRAHPRLHTRVVPQAGSMLPETPATPLPANFCVIHSGASNNRF